MSAQPVIQDGCMMGIPSNNVEQLWFLLKPLIEKPLERMGEIKRYGLDTIKERLLERKLQCWVAVGPANEILCVFITKIIVYPTGYKDFNIWLVGGSKIKYWLEDAWALFKEFARYNECDRILTAGRPGWNRVMQEFDKIDETVGFNLEL